MRLQAFLLLIIFLAGLARPALAQENNEISEIKAEIKFLQGKLQRIKQYINKLKTKIKTLAAEKKTKQAEELVKLTKKQQQRLSEIQGRIVWQQSQLAALAKKVEGKKAEIAVAQKGYSVRPNLFLKAGLQGGAGVGGFGFALPVSLEPLFELQLNAAYGSGKSYTVFVVQAGWRYRVTPALSVAANFDQANYSEKVAQIPGLTGNVDQGGRFGAGLGVGFNFGRLLAELGYSSALGLTFSSSFRF